MYYVWDRHTGEYVVLSNEESSARSAEFDGLPRRVRNILLHGGWKARAQVAAATDEELYMTRNLGEGTLAQVRKYIPHEPVKRPRRVRKVCPHCEGDGFIYE